MIEGLLNEIQILEKAEAMYHVNEVYKEESEASKLMKDNKVKTIGRIQLDNSPHVYLLQINKVKG